MIRTNSRFSNINALRLQANCEALERSRFQPYLGTSCENSGVAGKHTRATSKQIVPRYACVLLFNNLGEFIGGKLAECTGLGLKAA